MSNQIKSPVSTVSKTKLIPTDDLSQATICYVIKNPYPTQSLVNNTYYRIHREADHKNNIETYVLDEYGRRNFSFCQFGFKTKLYVEGE